MIEAQWIGGPRDGEVVALPELVDHYEVTVPRQIMLNDQPLPGQFLAEQVSYRVVPGGETGYRILWHA